MAKDIKKEIYEFKTHNRDGKVNHMRLNKILFLTWFSMLIIAIPSEIFLLGYFQENLNPFLELGIFNALWTFLSHTLINNFNSWQFNIYFFSSLSIALIVYLLNLKRYKKASSFQKVLSSVGFSQYYMTKYNKKQDFIELDLVKGEKMSVIEDFNRAEEKICQQFGRNRMKIEAVGTSKIRINFLQPIPNIKTAPKDIKYSKYLKENSLFLGISDIKGKPIFGIMKEEGKGLFNGHWLIVGGSGSGKSFSIKELLKNVLFPKNFINYNKIFVINFKKSADYNFMKDIEKVEYAQELDQSLKLLKKILLLMFNIYYYNTKYSQDNFTQFQVLVIIDEIQTLLELEDAKGLSTIQKNTVKECLFILEMLGSKSRAANITLMVILQKGDANSLPSTAFRQNLRNRFMLKQENISSAHLVVNRDTTDEHNINPLRLLQGQYIYNDTLTGEVKQGFTVLNDYEPNIDELNKLKFSNEIQEAINEVNSYKKISIEAIKIEREREEKLEADGKKTYYDNFDDLENNEFDDIFVEAEKRIKALKKEDLKIETVEKNKEESIEEEPFKLPNIEINIKEEKEEATTEELNQFIEDIDEVNDLKEEDINLNNEDFNDTDLDDLDFELEELEKEALKKMNEDKNTSKNDNEFIDDFKFDDNELN